MKFMIVTLLYLAVFCGIFGLENERRQIQIREGEQAQKSFELWHRQLDIMLRRAELRGACPEPIVYHVGGVKCDNFIDEYAGAPNDFIIEN